MIGSKTKTSKHPYEGETVKLRSNGIRFTVTEVNTVNETVTIVGPHGDKITNSIRDFAIRYERVKK